MAQDRARALGHDHIGTEHVLLALLGEQQGLAAQALTSVGLTAKGAEAQVIRTVGKGEAPSVGWLRFTAHAKNVLDRASVESRSLGQDVVATEHMLLALLREDEGVGVRVLCDFDVDLYQLRDELIVRAGGSYVPHGDEDTSNAAGPTIDPGWLDGLPTLLKPLGEEIRALGRAPDLGDLLLTLVCVPDTPAAEALAELGLDAEALAER